MTYKRTFLQTTVTLLARLKYGLVLLAGLIAIVFFFVLSAESWQKYQSRHWPNTVAQIEHVKLQIAPDNTGSINYGYSYRVNGAVHTKNMDERANKKSPLSTQTKARWQSYLNPNDITIYYNPYAPQKSLQSFERIQKLSELLLIEASSAFILLFGGAMCCVVAFFGFKET